ncbi:MAG: DUF4430 domain-containing protein [Defluviitaleaceae bacterium]|nr:DUF4430 domain-containing protein [Defluviitaleaceae bacterium]
MFKKLMALLVMVSMTIASAQVFAADEDSSITVFIRVESGIPGAEETILPRTAVTVAGVDKLTALELLGEAVEYEATVSEYGAMVNSIGGVSDDNFQCFWMFAVNDAFAETGADAFELFDGDEIVWYCVDWQVAAYSFFEQKEITVGRGEYFSLNLFGLDFMEGPVPVAGAMINIYSGEEGAILPLIAYFTDDDGEASVFLPSAGRYEISASKHDENETPMISKPLCIVNVIEDGGKPQDIVDGGIFPSKIIYDAKDGTLNYYMFSMKFDEAVMPFFVGDLLYFPVRAVAEYIGATVGWDAATYTATVTFGDFEMKFKTTEPIGDYGVFVIEGVSFLPAIYIVEQLELGELIVHR